MAIILSTVFILIFFIFSQLSNTCNFIYVQEENIVLVHRKLDEEKPIPGQTSELEEKIGGIESELQHASVNT